MTCNEFRYDLHEYIDGTLNADRVSAMDLHLQCCATCTRNLQLERELGLALRTGLHSAVNGMTMNRRVAGRILDAAIPAPRWSDRLMHSFTGYRMPVFVSGAALLLTLVAILLRSQWAVPTAHPNSSQIVISIDVPYEADEHVLEVHDGMVIDGIVTHVIEYHGTL